MNMLNGAPNRYMAACAVLATLYGISAQAEETTTAAPTPAAETATEPMTTAAATPAPGAAPATAAEAAPASPWSFNVTVANQYVTRGFSNSKGHPVIQGGVDYVHPSGFNFGFWMSTLSDDFVQGSWAETDYYAGYTKAFGDINVGAQLYYYIYPNGKFKWDGHSGISESYNYGEFVPTFNYKWFTAKYWYTYTRDYFGINDATMFTTGRGHSRGSGYLDLNVNYDLGKGYALIAHYGHQEVKNYEAINWHDGKLGISKSFDGGWTAAVAATKAWTERDNNLYGPGQSYDWRRYSVSPSNDTFNPIKGTIVLSITKVF